MVLSFKLSINVSEILCKRSSMTKHVNQIMNTNVHRQRRALIIGERNVHKELVNMPLEGFWCENND